MSQFRSILALCAAALLALAATGQASAGYLVANVQGGNTGPVRAMSPPPRPTPKPTPTPKPIPAPSDVRPVQSVHDCAAALALLATICDNGVKSGDLQLLWKDGASKLDGYKVYRVDGSHHNIVVTTSNGTSPKYALITKPGGGYKGACYAVTGYLGNRESARSEKYCVESGSTASTETFSPAHVRSYLTYIDPTITDPNNYANTLSLAALISKLQGSNFGAELPSQLLAANRSVSVGGSAYVGYQDAYYAESIDTSQFRTGYPNGYARIKSRAGYDFNLGKLSNRKIYSAILTLDVAQTVQDTAGHTRFRTDDYSCADTYLLGKDFWWSYSGALNNTSSGGHIGLKSGPVVTVDVTGTVENWAADGNQRYYGFILSNAIADTNAKPAYPDLACFTKYYNATLKVIYF